MKKHLFTIILLASSVVITNTSCDISDDALETPATENSSTEGNTIAKNATKYFTIMQLDSANTAKDAKYLTDAEKLVIQYCNLARMNGSAFNNAFLADLLSSNNSYEQSLVDTLKNIADKPLLYPNEQLCKAAEYHANDIGPEGKTGHNSSDGTNFAVRVRSFYNGGWVAENISYGHDNALEIVRQLLIDKDVASLGHRKNILNENYCRIGIAIRYHKTYKHCCVQDFSDDQGD